MKKATFPRMGPYTEAFAYLAEQLGYEPIIPPKTNQETIKLGVRHSSSMVCLTADTNITLDDYTSKPIKDIKEGDMVLTHKGRFRKVAKTFKREYNGDLLHIDCGGLLKLNITPEHQIFGVKREKITCINFKKHQLQIVCKPEMKNSIYCKKHNRGCKKKRGLVNFNPYFIQAKDLNKGDFIAIPIPKVTECSLSSFKLPNTSKLIKYRNNEFMYNKDLLRILGYWLAEGSFIPNNKVKPNGISFSFSSKESNYINEIKTLLSYNFKCNTHSRSQKKSVIELIVYSTTLANLFFSLGNKYSYSKTLHKDLMILEPNLQLEIVKGFFRGDGHYCCESYSTHIISKKLSEQLFWILIRNNIKPCYYSGQQKNRKIYYAIKVIQSDDIKKIDNEINVKEKQSISRYVKLDDYILVQISDIKKDIFNGDVYNIEVEEDNSYIANYLAVHNCYPYKITLGNLIQGLEKGANAIIATGVNKNDKRPETCRFLFYFHIQEQILRRLGYKFDVIWLNNGALSILKTLKRMGNNLSYFQCVRILRNTLKKIEEIEEREFKFEKKDINIGLTGEAFTLWENSVNYDIIKKLKDMGVGVDMSINLSWFLKHQIHMADEKKYLHKELEKYMPKRIGGHGYETLVNTIDYAKKGFDGVIHLLPLSCLTEDTMITLDDYTSKPIKDIKEGDMVLTHKGRFRKVAKTFKREYNGDLLHIDCGGLLKLNITPEHPLFAFKRLNSKSNKKIYNKNPSFIEAKNLCTGDFIAIPKPIFNKLVPKMNNVRFLEDENYFYTPIRNIQKENFNGIVYNLEIEEDNSYIANLLAVHNCMPESLVEMPMDMISKDYNIPVYRFPFDEANFEIGFDTRLSTFISLLRRNKTKNEEMLCHT